VQRRVGVRSRLGNVARWGHGGIRTVTADRWQSDFIVIKINLVNGKAPLASATTPNQPDPALLLALKTTYFGRAPFVLILFATYTWSDHNEQTCCH
jgi:hypothetical protein